MYELEDSIPEGGGNPVGYAVNSLRVEVNKIAEVLDEMDERIKEITKEQIENVHHHPERNRDRD